MSVPESATNLSGILYLENFENREDANLRLKMLQSDNSHLSYMSNEVFTSVPFSSAASHVDTCARVSGLLQNEQKTPDARKLPLPSGK
ncbi:unnamed protein product [Dibothriocephalus latus]|uniref:Uncharacterized protein n=1 Tax=Dibothriocephalus latus TaxID=60516 RepID=A0A3P6SIJ6_DIBLA|nr:unnamed protein product [Dibothriocephalus latus]